MKCFNCATEMDEHVRHGVKIDHCPACGGVWLDKGELDHLIAALRPAVTLPDPDPPRPDPHPEPRPEPRRPVPGANSAKGTRSAKSAKASEPPRKPKSDRAEDDRGSSRGSGRVRPYRGRYSPKDWIGDVLDEIFDFD